MNKCIVALSFLLLAQAVFAQVTTTKSYQQIDTLLHSFYMDSLPGAAVAVVQNNHVLFEKDFGVRNTTGKEKITTTTNFNIASLTKQFTALAILQLEAQHRLALSDKLSRFFPDMNKRVADAVTVRQLLTHSSGIVDHYDYTNTSHQTCTQQRGV